MTVFGDQNDLDLRPPPDAPGPTPTEHRTTVEMSARQFMNMIV